MSICKVRSCKVVTCTYYRSDVICAIYNWTVEQAIPFINDLPKTTPCTLRKQINIYQLNKLLEE